MKRIGLLLLLSATCILPAATCIDAGTGTKAVKNPDGSISYSSDGTGGPIGAVAGMLGLGGVASVLSNIWLALRNKSASQAVVAAVAGVEAIKEQLTPEQKAKMVSAQEAVGAKARQIVRAVAHKLEGGGG